MVAPPGPQGGAVVICSGGLQTSICGRLKPSATNLNTGFLNPDPCPLTLLS
jgi:hypothetical protein